MFRRLLLCLFSPVCCSLLQDTQESMQALTSAWEDLHSALAEAALPSLLSTAASATIQKDTPIAIIGGGLAGLSAAVTLRELGYFSVSLFEAEQQLGGKVMTHSYEGHHIPMGALGINPVTARTLMRLEFPAARMCGATSALTLLPQPKMTPIMKVTENEGLCSKIEGQWGKLGEQQQHQQGLSEEQMQQQGKSDEKHYRNCLKFIFRSAQGYGLWDAADPGYEYWCSMSNSLSCNTGQVADWSKALGAVGLVAPDLGVPIGVVSTAHDYGALFASMLAPLNVSTYTNTHITEVQRSAEGINITTAAGEVHRAGKLVIATDFKAAGHFLDLRRAESELLQHVGHVPYTTVAFTGHVPLLHKHNNTHMMRSHVLTENLQTSRIPCPVMMAVDLIPGQPIYGSGNYEAANTTQADVEECLRQTVEALGGTVEKIIVIKRWDNYFPHVRSDANVTRPQFYKLLDALQGQDDTFYVGELPSRSRMPNTRSSRMATQSMIKKFF